ncbi:hypothetical protein BH24CHL4_BH24CHL4_01460 [soil metagenome]
MIPENASRRIAVEREASLRMPAALADIVCVTILCGVSLLAIWRIVGGGTLIGQDSATQFYPWYSYLGERLRDFDLPAWNPSQFSGAPFAGDPQSGWMYVPAMVLFTALPVTVAVSAYLIFHLLLAGLGAYALARVLGIGPVGALTAGIAYELSGPVFSRAVCCPAQVQVVSWVPILLVGLEMAVNRESWASRLRWMALAGFAMSQVMASWLGQGSYYVALLGGGYLVYRGLLDPGDRSRGWRQRVLVTGVTGIGAAAISAGLAAAGLLPRLKYNGLSNLAGGVYKEDHATSAVSGGWQAGGTLFGEVTSDPYYPGSVVIALVAVSLVLTRGRRAAPFFTVVMLACFVLAANVQTPLHSLAFAILPRFEDLHRHWPERVAMVGFIAVALLAGAAVDALPGWAGRRKQLLGIAMIPIGIASTFVIGLRYVGDVLPGVVLGGVAIVCGALVLVGLPRARSALPLIPAALVALLFLDLLAANARMIGNGPYGGYHEVDLQRYLQPSNGAQVLVGLGGADQIRYFGFDPRLQQHAGGWPVLYRYQFGNERTRALAVNNRATLHGIQDVQGYNPVQLQSYVDFIRILNGEPQDYHDANILAGGLDSPLLDVLNARYMLVPSPLTIELDTTLTGLSETYPTVFDDGLTRILERPSAMPRAWIVHDAVQAAGTEAMELLAGGTINPRTTVLIDGAIPPMQAGPATGESAVVMSYDPERISIQTDSATPGMLVLSEVAYPAWKATVDGVPVAVSTAYGLIRATPLPAGTHVVEFTFDSQTEQRGLAITLATLVLLGSTFAGVGLWRRRNFRPPAGQ